MNNLLQTEIYTFNYMRNIKLILLVTLMIMCSDAASSKKRDGRKFWNTKVGKAILWADNFLESSQTSGIDTTYIDIPKLNRYVYLGSYDYFQQYKLNVPIGVSDEMESRFPGLRDQAFFRTRMHTVQSEIELGIDYKGLTLELPITLVNRYNQSFGLAKNGSQWGFRIRYKNMRHMDGTINNGVQNYFADYYEQHPDPEVTPEDIEKMRDTSIPEKWNNLKIFYAEAYWVFNTKHFSLSSGLYADMVQKKSAGGVFVMANYFQSRYVADELFIASQDAFRTNQVSLGAGYGYNWSFLRGRLVVHLSFIPMLTLYNHFSHTIYYADGWNDDPNKEKASELFDVYYASRGHSRFALNCFGRLAINYSWNRYLISFLSNYKQYLYHNSSTLRILNREADAQVNFGVRF